MSRDSDYLLFLLEQGSLVTGTASLESRTLKRHLPPTMGSYTSPLCGQPTVVAGARRYGAFYSVQLKRVLWLTGKVLFGNSRFTKRANNCSFCKDYDFTK